MPMTVLPVALVLLLCGDSQSPMTDSVDSTDEEVSEASLQSSDVSLRDTRPQMR